MLINNENKISVDIYNPNEAEEIINFIDWDNFTHKTWRFWQKVLVPELSGGCCGYQQEIWAKLLAKKQEVCTYDLAISELKKYVSEEQFTKYCLPVIESWGDVDINKKIDSIFSGISKDMVNDFGDDPEAWKRGLSMHIIKEEATYE